MAANAIEQSVQRLESDARKICTTCHNGEMVYRRWAGPADAETVLLVHGGSGSWLHWYRNIAFLQQHCNVVTVDLPGLGDSAEPPPDYTASDVVDTFVNGTVDVMKGTAFHIAAFSWGCAVSSQAAIHLGAQLQSLLLIGPASLGDIPRRGGMKPLLRRTPDMSASQVQATNRTNLARLMFCDESRIDDTAVYIQTRNTQKARFNSPQFARTKLVLEGVGRTRTPLKVLYGQFDAPGLPNIAGKEDLFKAVRDDMEFEIIADAGHWLQYEQADACNEAILQWLIKNGRT